MPLVIMCLFICHYINAVRCSTTSVSPQSANMISLRSRTLSVATAESCAMWAAVTSRRCRSQSTPFDVGQTAEPCRVIHSSVCIALCTCTSRLPWMHHVVAIMYRYQHLQLLYGVSAASVLTVHTHICPNNPLAKGRSETLS